MFYQVNKSAYQIGIIGTQANVVASNGSMKVAISKDPGAIGYVSMGHVDETVKAIELDGVAATRDNAKSGAYPVVRKLFMNTKGKPTELAQAFIDYIFSAEGAAIREESGFIPIGAE